MASQDGSNQVSPPSSSHVCKQCNKEFSSSTALVRHSKNHSAECTYICPICDIGFFRHDLLTRHMKLHVDGVESSDAADGPQPKRRIRKRCHTACDRCRDSKKRCDGRQPCGACNTAGQPCRFDTSSQRISRVLNRERRSSVATPRVSAADSAALEQVETNSTTNRSQGEKSYVVVDMSPGENELPLEMDSNVQEMHDPIDTPFLDLMPWPWLHENTFLTDDSSATMSSIISADIGLPLELYRNAFRDQNCQVTVPVAVDGTSGNPPKNASSPTFTSGHMGHAIDPGPNNVMERGTPGPTSNDLILLKRQVVDEVVRSASLESRSFSNLNRAMFWEMASQKIIQVFQLQHTGLTVMNNFLQLYLDHFHPLWPLLSLQNLEPLELHPYLYLVISSIGAMYGGSLASEYGSMMHAAMCNYLVAPLELELEDDAQDLLWLAQARLLTQVAALYFGQTKAFSFAQHLGVLLVTQARKANFFSAGFYQQRMALFHRSKNISSAADRLKLWLDVEARRRLAFGIFRGDTFTSVTLNTKPLVSLEELDVEFPTCQIVWSCKRIPPHHALDIIDRERPSSRALLASDVYHITLDRDEILPPLEPLAHELLLFGLQWPLWTFFHKRDLLHRLTGQQGDDALCEIPLEIAQSAFTRPRGGSLASETESLDTVSRRMADLLADRERLKLALGKWERGLPIAKTLCRSEQDRNFVLSSLMLYHLGHIRLLAPIEEVHQIQYHVMSRRRVDNEMLQEIIGWANLPEARSTMTRVGSIWSLLRQESQRSPDRQSKANILAFIGLHHGAALLWAFTGCRTDKTESEWLDELGFDETFPRPAACSFTEESELFQPFVDLFHWISPAGWTSFIQATKVLGKVRFLDVPLTNPVPNM